MKHVLRCLSCTLVLFFLLASVRTAPADVSPGDVIDESNWEKVKGLLPEPVLNWVKQGDFILNIDEPNFEFEAVSYTHLTPVSYTHLTLPTTPYV